MKPLGHKAYGSIPHLPGSNRGPGDHGLDPQQAAILTGERKVGRDWRIVVQEKLDGSCVSVAKINGEIVAIGRAGYLAETAPQEHIRLFASWVAERRERFDALLSDGERVVGEWMLMATAIRYWIASTDDLFVAFDIMRGHDRVVPSVVESRCWAVDVRPARTLSEGPRSAPSAHVFACFDPTFESECLPEGVVYRAIHNDRIAFLGKWVRGDFEPGRYLGQDIYNYPPQWLRARSEAA